MNSVYSMYIFACAGQPISIQIYDDSMEPVENAICLYKDINKVVESLYNKYNVNIFYITGQKVYYSRIKEKLEENFAIDIKEVYND